MQDLSICDRLALGVLALAALALAVSQAAPRRPPSGTVASAATATRHARPDNVCTAVLQYRSGKPNCRLWWL